MEKVRVECLRCGSPRTVVATESHRLDAGDCPRCEYVGWAPSSALDERVRRRIREQPPERRVGLHVV